MDVSGFTLESILSSSVASSLSTLPFQVLRTLFQGGELVLQEGETVHSAAMEVGAIQMVLLCLAVLSHHKPRATNQSHKLALQALSALTGRYCTNLNIKFTLFTPCSLSRTSRNGCMYFHKLTFQNMSSPFGDTVKFYHVKQ